MQTLYVEVPYASFRKSFARSFAETYPLPPPATVYGMLLSLVGERFRQRHAGVGLAFAYKCREPDQPCEGPCVPRVATTLRKLSRFKYGVGTKGGPKPDFVETLCGIEFLCWVDSSSEARDVTPTDDTEERARAQTLEERVVAALKSPSRVERYGVLSLGLSDDAVNDVRLCEKVGGKWHRLLLDDAGATELPVWVDHTGSAWTRWQRYRLEANGATLVDEPGSANWRWTKIQDPRAAQTLS